MDDCFLATFDKDEFPSNKSDKKEKEKKLYKVIKQCWYYIDAFKDSLDFQIQNKDDHIINYNFMNNNSKTSSKLSEYKKHDDKKYDKYKGRT